MKNIYLSLGSNMGNREKNLHFAHQIILQNIGAVLASSNIYETEPWGFQSPQNFLNQVIEIETDYSPLELLAAVKEIEVKAGRSPKKTKEYESRPLDIDILFYSEMIVHQTHLNIPHQHLHQRIFVLKPLNDIAADFLHPTLKQTIFDLYNACEDNTKIWVYKSLLNKS